MLSRGANPGWMRRPPASQAGIVLFFALIVLVMMMLGAIALMRSTLTTNLVAGNLATQQAATVSADRGVETAVNWLENQNVGTALHTSKAAATDTVRYAALRQDPAAGQSWEDFWNAALVPAGLVNSLAEDAAGMTVRYVIQRLCNAQGDPAAGKGCEISPAIGTASNSSKGVGVVGLSVTGQVYYRITVRVSGPRNTLSLVQTIVAM